MTTNNNHIIKYENKYKLILTLEQIKWQKNDLLIDNHLSLSPIKNIVREVCVQIENHKT